MKPLLFSDLNLLSVRDRIVNVKDGKEYNYEFVSILPSNNNYVIISEGGEVKSVHKTFFTNFYCGDYNANYIGKKMIEQLNENIKSIRNIYCV